MAKIITPVITVLNDREKPDVEGNKKVIDFLIDGGVDGILVLGSTGEFPNLSVRERLDFLTFYAEYTSGRCELLAGTGCVSFADTLLLSQAALDLGMTPMVIGPYYYALDQEKLFVYYDQLAKNLKGDMYLYNFPARTGHSLAPETVRRLAQANPNIVGLKDSVNDAGHTIRILQATAGLPFRVYSGFDDQFLTNLASGGAGSIGALSNIAPELWSDLIRSANAGHLDRAVTLLGFLQRLMPLYDLDANCSLLLKKLLARRGLDISTRAVIPYHQMEDRVFEQATALFDAVMADYRALD